jgi:hypothetical protein
MTDTTQGKGRCGQIGCTIMVPHSHDEREPWRITLGHAALSTVQDGSVREEGGWIVGNGDGTKWRTWTNGMSDWTSKKEAATRYHRREDAEAVHREDDDAWTVKLFATDARALPQSPAPISGDAPEAPR